MDKKKNIILISSFLIFIYTISIANIVTPDKDISEVENRELQKFPEISDMRNGDFSALMDTYCSDQFIFRDFLMKMDIKLQMITGKSEVNGHYITDDGWILGKNETDRHTDSQIESWSNQIYSISEKASKKGMNTIYFSTPHKVNTLDFMYPKFVDKKYGLYNETKFLESLEEKGIHTINTGEYFKNRFSEEELKEMYFKTDHHWNSIGAFEAYKYFVEDYSKYKNIDIKVDESIYKREYMNRIRFDGSYNRNLANIVSDIEDIPIISPIEEYEYYRYDDNKFKQVDKQKIVALNITEDKFGYEDVYTKNESLYKIVNEKSKTDESILVIRDSYEAAMNSMLSEIFREVYIVDLRVIDMSIDEILDICDSDTLMFMFNNGLVMDDMLSYVK